MKLNKLASVLLLTMGMATTAAHAANEGNGKITFYGSIIDAACSIYPGDDDQRIPLGQVAAQALENEGTSTPVQFSIRLDNCAVSEEGTKAPDVRAASANAVSVTFTGSSDAANNDLLGIVGTASGAGVVITDLANTPIALGTPSSLFTLNEGLNSLDFAAHLKGNGETIVTGEFESVANFALAYQ